MSEPTVESVQGRAHDMRIALYQPDIPGNAGAILRLGACLGFGVEIIGPAGFDISDRTLRRAGMDYIEIAALTRHVSWETFCEWIAREDRRMVLMTTGGDVPLWDFRFRSSDVLLFGRESSGVPESVHEAAQARIRIPMPGGGRSLNLATSAAIASGEALRQAGHSARVART